MGSGDPRDLPAFVLDGLPPGVRHAVASPAIRWRVIVEQLSNMERDLLLETVVRLHQAGERSAERISDLLQLPVDLVQHLQARAINERVAVVSGGLHSTETRVVWVYRDRVSGELYPEPSGEIPQVSLTFRPSTDSATLEVGSAGRPSRVSAVVLPPSPGDAVAPSALELARFSQPSKHVNQRTAVVSEGEACLVISPVRQTTGGPVATTRSGIRMAGLTRTLQRLTPDRPEVGRWLRSLPEPDLSDPEGQAAVPLRRVMAAVKGAHREWTEHRGPAAERSLLSQLDLAIRRYCDQGWYVEGADPSGSVHGPAHDDLLSARLSLSAADIAALNDSAGLATVVRGWVGMAVRTDSWDISDLSLLARAAASLIRLVAVGGDAQAIDALTREVTGLCEQLLEQTEASYVQG